MVLLLPAFSPAGYPLLKSFEVKGKSVTSDKFGCGYVLTGNNQLTKVCPDSTTQRTYNAVTYGSITSVDVTNPFKILVFYKDFATVALLDNTLSLQSTVNLQNLNILQPAAMCLASDNNIWVYDEQEFRIKKVTDSGQQLTQSEDFTILFPEPSHPDFMLEKDGKLFVNDPQNGIRIFDVFGTYSKTIPILKGLHHFQYIKDQIIYFKDGMLLSFNTITFDTKIVLLPDNGLVAIDADIQNDILLTLTDSKLSLYGMK